MSLRQAEVVVDGEAQLFCGEAIVFCEAFEVYAALGQSS
jgi:hypothetical protein